MDFPGQVRAKLQWVLLDRMRDVVPRVTDGWWNETRDSSSSDGKSRRWATVSVVANTVRWGTGGGRKRYAIG